MNPESQQELDPEVLLRIIETQTEIARLGLDLGNVMTVVAERSQGLMNANGAVVELAEGDEMVYRASSGIAKSQLGLRLNRATSLSGLCIAEGRPLISEDCESDPRVDRDACRRVGLRSMVVAPLKHGETVVGVLKVLSQTPRFFSPRDVAILGLMTDLIAASMYHAARVETSELYYRATHDPLTGLANRALFFDRLRHQLVQAQRTATALAVLNLDMDGLKQINDSFGHRAGDAAIRELAARIKEASRVTDTVARIGGDEFAVLLPDGHESAVKAQGARLTERIAMPFEFEGNPLKIGASIGAAAYPDDGVEPDALLESADQAMYRTKKLRKAGEPPS